MRQHFGLDMADSRRQSGINQRSEKYQRGRTEESENKSISIQVGLTVVEFQFYPLLRVARQTEWVKLKSFYFIPMTRLG